MPTDRINGYNITGNHGTGTDREYHVCNAAGDILHRAKGRKSLALNYAANVDTGDVPAPDPPPPPEPSASDKLAATVRRPPPVGLPATPNPTPAKVVAKSKPTTTAKRKGTK